MHLVVFIFPYPSRYRISSPLIWIQTGSKSVSSEATKGENVSNLLSIIKPDRLGSNQLL